MSALLSRGRSGVRFSAGILNHFARNVSLESANKGNIHNCHNIQSSCGNMHTQKNTSKKQSVHFTCLLVFEKMFALQTVVFCESSVNLLDIKLVLLFRTAYTLSQYSDHAM